jgi:hypothetical protein
VSWRAAAALAAAAALTPLVAPKQDLAQLSVDVVCEDSRTQSKVQGSEQGSKKQRAAGSKGAAAAAATQEGTSTTTHSRGRKKPKGEESRQASCSKGFGVVEAPRSLTDATCNTSTPAPCTV